MFADDGSWARRLTETGAVFLGAGLAALGALSLVSGDFAFVWQPVPDWMPWREGLARLSGLVLLVGGAGIFVRPVALTAARLQAVYLFLWLLLLRLTRVAASPLSEGLWSGAAENIVLLAGGWLLLGAYERRDGASNPSLAATPRGRRLARYLVAVALPLIGLSHFTSLTATATLVPAWLPDRLTLAAVTGTCHIAAGVGLLLRPMARLAAILEAVMLTLLTALVWLPRVWATPASRFEWTALFVSAAITGGVWVLAGSFEAAGPAKTP